MTAELTPFLALHFRGGRFDEDPGMPVEALGELVAYRDLVVEVARALFRRQNPSRQRAPRGFVDRARLRIRQVDEGSAVPVLERVESSERGLLPDEFEQARDLISDAIASADRGEPVPDAFPRSALVFFNRLGQGLRDEESIELRKPDADAGPHYTQRTRRALLSDRVTYQRDAEAVGWVTELDADRMRFELRETDGSVIPAYIGDLVAFDEVKDALTPANEGPQVTVSGVAVFNRDDKLIRFVSVHDLSSEESDDTIADAVAAAATTAGWLDGEGEETDQEVLRRARQLLESIVERGAAVPRVYPIPDGGIQAEWSIGDREISVAVEPGGSLYVISVNVRTGQSEDLTLTEDDPERVLRLVR